MTNTMTPAWRLLLAVPCLSLILTGSGWAQDSVNTGLKTSIGLRLGYGIPTGDWATSRVAPEIQMFTGGITYGGDITIRVAEHWALVFGASHSVLSGSNWESYTREKGDVVSVSATLSDVSISLRPFLMITPTDQISLEFGAAGLFAGGNEVVDGQRYEYDFFSTFRFGFQGAVQYDRLLSNAVAITIRGGGVIAPGGMNYADGESRTILIFPICAGFRFMF
jgi:hypothetical protein